MSTSHHIFSQESQSPTVQNQAKLLYITCAQYSQEWNCTIHTTPVQNCSLSPPGGAVFSSSMRASRWLSATWCWLTPASLTPS